MLAFLGFCDSSLLLSALVGRRHTDQRGPSLGDLDRFVGEFEFDLRRPSE
jgi:hypothetical protein